MDEAVSDSGEEELPCYRKKTQIWRRLAICLDWLGSKNGWILADNINSVQSLFYFKISTGPSCHPSLYFQEKNIMEFILFAPFLKAVCDIIQCKRFLKDN